jgi:tetratricopeptide (TPR) repeat protein
MTPPALGPRLAAALLLSLLGGIGCGDAPPATPIPRPDLSRAEPEVARAVTQALVEVERAPDSAAAWGVLGDRYRANRWLDEAARCYEQAERLQPEEFRWPHMVGRTLYFTDPAGAAAAFERASSIDPDYGPMHVFYGRTLMRLNRDDDALQCFEQAGRLDPEDPHAQVGLGQLALARREYEVARDHLQRAVESDPRYGEAHLALSQCFMALGDEQRAMQHAELAQQLPSITHVPDARAKTGVSPAGSLAHVDAGLALLEQNRLDQAIVEFREALENHPTNTSAHHNLGRALSLQGRYDEAVIHFREVIRIRETNARSQLALGQVLAILGRIDEAEQHLRRSIELEPNNAEARFTLGELLKERGELNPALEQLRDAVRLEPDYAEVHLYLGTLLAGARQLDEAREHLTTAVRLQPRNADARVNLGLTLFRLGRVEEAIVEFEQATREDSGHAHAFNGLATCLLSQGRTGEAIEAYRQAVRADPRWTTPALRLAWILATDSDATLRNGAEAVRLAERIVRSEGNNPNAFDTLAAALAEAGRSEDAQRAAQLALQLAARDPRLSAQIRERLVLYEQGFAYHSE